MMQKTISTTLRRAMLGAALLLAAAAPPMAQAADMEGYHFDDSVRLSGKPLQLNGLGIRAVSILKGYVAGLYVPQKGSDADALLAQKGPKRLTMRMLLGTGADTFIKAFDSGLHKNYSDDQVAAFQPRINVFNDNMRLIGRVKGGDVVDIEYLPESGTRLTYNGKPQGASIPGDDFYAALLKIFIGEHPVDKRLKRGLLGLPADQG